MVIVSTPNGFMASCGGRAVAREMQTSSVQLMQVVERKEEAKLNRTKYMNLKEILAVDAQLEGLIQNEAWTFREELMCKWAWVLLEAIWEQ